MSTDAFVSDDCVPVTPSDTAVLRAGCIKCTGTAGNIVVITLNKNKRTIPITTGEIINTLVTQVLVDGGNTTATGLYLYPAV